MGSLLTCPASIAIAGWHRRWSDAAPPASGLAVAAAWRDDGGVPRDAVTGGFGFTGRAIAEALLARGRTVVTLTTHPRPADPLAPRIEVKPLDFDRPAELAASLAGVDVLYNTYWIRFPRKGLTYETAVARSEVLLAAARQAGVRRIVHVSVVGARRDGPTPYVRGKGTLEDRIRGVRLEWAIVRPTLTFGPGDILFNNLAWALRRLPVYGIPGRGHYPIQPVHVDDVARICVESGEGPPGVTTDAAGPETPQYVDLVRLVRSAVGSRALIVPMPGWAVLAAGRFLAPIVHDVVLTRNEILELTTGFLRSHEPPRGTIAPSAWIAEHGPELGRRWTSELKRNYAR
jgi:nucleoside-diphosphate-sugar epimerase